MNELIRLLADKGLTNLAYNGFHVLGFIAVFIYVVWYGKKIGFPAWKAVLIVLIVYPIIYGWMYVLCWIESGFRVFGGNNIVRVFVYVPVVGIPVAKLLKVDIKKMLSLLAFAPLMVHGVSHFGCVFPGCCNGYPSSWGLYCPWAGDIRFPIQPIEAIGALAIIVILLIRAKRRSYIPDGLEFPIMLVLYGSSRFVFEFLRDNDKILFGISNLAFHALFMCAVGVIWIYVTRRKTAVQHESPKA